MCEFSERLIAWLDHELPTDEAAEVDQNVQTCWECRNRLKVYKEVSREFDAYCEAKTPKAPEILRLWVPVLSGTAAVAVVALLLAFPRTHIQTPPFRPSAEASPTAIAFKAAATPKKIRRRHVVVPEQSQSADWLPNEPAIQVAIPADAMFPPGAVPEGVHFIADVSIAPDGSVQRLRLLP